MLENRVQRVYDCIKVFSYFFLVLTVKDDLQIFPGFRERIGEVSLAPEHGLGCS